MQRKPIVKNSVMIVLCIVMLLVLVPAVQAAGATADELHAAPLNPEFIRYMKEKTYDSQVQSGTHGLGLVPSPIYRPDVKDVQMFGPTAGDRSTSYPATYDLRTTGKVSPVKDQNPWGTCWAFATFASLESTSMPATPTPVFSEKNLVNLAGFDYAEPQDAGGQMWMSTAYLTRWNGPVNSATDPYPSGTWTSSNNYPPVKHVQNVVFFPGRTSRTDNDNIKGALTRWGAVYSSLYWYDTFYNSTYTSYYQPASDSRSLSGHAVTIVGWDDNYAATNFTTAADGPGAWIVKNSWGTAWGSAGYFYISYYDKSFGSVIQTSGSKKDTAVFLGDSTSNYDTIYSYDKLGEVNDYSYGTTKTGSFANIFTANSSETIKAVGFYTTDVSVPYTISIYKNPTSGPVGGTPAATFNGTLAYMGYNTVAIPSTQQVQVTTGDRFSVVVQVTNPTNTVYIPIEQNSEGYTSGIVSQSGQGYLLGNSGWTDLKTQINNSHVCVKAYTSSTTTIPTVTGISPSSGTINGGTSVTITGTNFAGATVVNFGTTAASNVNVVSATSITATSPAHAAGIVDVTVTTPSGTSAISAADQFTYTATPTTNASTIGIFRTGNFYLASSNTDGGGSVNAFNFGMAGDVPVTGDWNADGTATVGIFRTGNFFLASSNIPGGGTVNAFNFGMDGDVPVAGKWSGSGAATVGIFRSGNFFLASSNIPGGGTVNAFNFGMAGDVPVAGDWDGDGTTTVGIFRSGNFFLAGSNIPGGGTVNAFNFGMAGDVPVTGDWNADGKTEVGIFRNGAVYLASSNIPGGGTVTAFTYGMAEDVPVAGKWT
jgi:C1A family cysteine protease